MLKRSIRMPRFSKEELKELCDEILMWAEKVEEIEVAAHETTGETKAAYAIVHKDFLWKIQRKVGSLWHYLCGCEDMSPFDTPELVDVSGSIVDAMGATPSVDEVKTTPPELTA